MQKICCKYQGTLHPFYLYTRKIQWKHMWCCSGHCITKLYRIGAITTFMRIVVAFNTLSVILAYMTSNIINSCHVHRDLMVIRKQISNTLHVLHYLHMPIKLRDAASTSMFSAVVLHEYHTLFFYIILSFFVSWCRQMLVSMAISNISIQLVLQFDFE